MFVRGPGKTSTFTGGSFINNSAKDGGAIYLDGNEAVLTVSNASFSGNTANGSRNEYGGGNIAYLYFSTYFNQPKLILTGCTGATNGTYQPTSHGVGTRIES